MINLSRVSRTEHQKFSPLAFSSWWLSVCISLYNSPIPTSKCMPMAVVLFYSDIYFKNGETIFKTTSATKWTTRRLKILPPYISVYCLPKNMKSPFGACPIHNREHENSHHHQKNYHSSLVFNMRRTKQEVEPTNLGLCVPSKNLSWPASAIKWTNTWLLLSSLNIWLL
jgi:hypothetical protein